jgi:CheY-like chemotaxis protein
MKKKILIVDDDPGIVKLLSMLLMGKNYEILIALDGQQGIKIAQKEIPNLILLDIRMPNISGIEVFEKLLQLDITKNIPVIFMTAYPKPEIINQVLMMGAKNCISKPFISADFDQTIQMSIA